MYYETDQYDKKLYSQTSNSLNFQYLEGAMIFALRYIENCEIVNNVLSINGDVVYSTGKRIRGGVEQMESMK